MKKIFLVTIITMAFACSACSGTKKAVVNTPDSTNSQNNTSVTEAPGKDQKKEDLTDIGSDDKEPKDSSSDVLNNQKESSSNDNSASDFQVLDELSDDLSSFQIQINDVIYSLPMKYSDFTAQGFVMKDDDNEKLESGYYTWSYFNRGDLKLKANIINTDEKELPISECYIGSIEIDKDNKENGKGVFIALPKGVIFNQSTLDDVKAAYGEPSSMYEGSLYTLYTYEFGIYQKVEIEVGLKSGVVDSINVRNLISE
jgi:hypothetical protein|nr:hypothetical protein [uncultured Lachnoclostridium sp.]